MPSEVTAWIDHDTLRVPQLDLRPAADRMPPEVEARVITILTAARYENIMLVVGDGPYNVTEHDIRHICNALDASGALHRSRPA